MELGEWIGGRIIENLDNRGSDNRSFTVPIFLKLTKIFSRPCREESHKSYLRETLNPGVVAVISQTCMKTNEYP